ncbi:MAG: glycoside hydrolase family 43 protein [Nocardioidaceae bacterium]
MAASSAFLRRARTSAGRLLRRPGRPNQAAGTPDPPPPAPSADVSEARGDLPAGFFVNPIAEGADPFVVRDGDRYLWCQSEGNIAIAIWESDRLSSLGRKHVVWRAPAEGPCSKEVWAPELFKLDARWYIYFAADDGRNRNHRTYVLKAQTEDPLGAYALHGPLLTGEGADSTHVDAWAIDLTVLEHGGQRYALWSGWPLEGEGSQHLFIAAMASPLELTGPRVVIAKPGEFVWQRTEETPQTRGLVEAPQVLRQDGRTFVTYSCSASWLPTYKVGMLELTGSDPLDPGSWTSFPHPVFQASEATYGVGHGTFVRSLDGREWWHVFHAKVDRANGWRRAIHVQPMSWRPDGTPDLGAPLSPGEPIELPAATVIARRDAPCSWDLTDADALSSFDFYGHHQFFEESAEGLHLGIEPTMPINAYRSGEKVVVRDGTYADFELTTNVRFVRGRRAAGVMFRTTAPAVGFDAQRGYFAGLALDRGALVLGKTNGREFVPLAELALAFDEDATHTLTVRARGGHIMVSTGDAVIDHHDDDYSSGSVGLRVVDTHACFTSLAVAPIVVRPR